MNRYGFSAEPFGMVLKFLSTFPEWNLRKKYFFYSSFLNFSGIWAKIFSDFWPKNFKTLWKLTSAYPQEQLVALNFFQKFWTVLDSLQKPLAWFSKFYLRVQSKICGRNSLLFFLSEFCRILSKSFSNFRPKNFKKSSKLLFACADEHFLACRNF